MLFFNKLKFISTLLLLSPKVFWLIFKDFCSLSDKKRADIDSYNKNAFESIVRFAFENSKYYETIFEDKGVDYYIENKSKIPVLNKEEIKRNFNEIVAKENVKYRELSSGGSTGEPLKYQISLLSDAYSHFLLYKGLRNGGYCFGDKIAVFAGGSLVSRLKTKREMLVSFLLNKRKYSSYGVDHNDLDKIILDMNKWQPNILRGYASSILFLAEHILQNNSELHFKLKSVFTTSEMLTSEARKVISSAFSCPVFDSYGLNDGGLTAFECTNHRMHIDPERGLLEVIDEVTGEFVFDKPGIIVATTLVDKRFPLIRYNTGDLGVLTKKICSCGKETYVLDKLVGRETDFLSINGKKIGSPVLTVLMGQVECNKYQIIQEVDESITLLLSVPNESYFNETDRNKILNSFESHFGDISINILITNMFEESKNGKHKFILRRTQA